MGLHFALPVTLDYSTLLYSDLLYSNTRPLTSFLHRLYRRFKFVVEKSFKLQSSRERYVREVPVAEIQKKRNVLLGRRDALSTSPHNCLFAIKGIIQSFAVFLIACSTPLHSALNPLCSYPSYKAVNMQLPMFHSIPLPHPHVKPT